jgi:streptomycin 6-kinase
VPGVTIPANLGLQAGDNEEMAAWTQRLPELIKVAADRWALKVGEPYQPGGNCSWVAPAVTADGEPAVLKLGWRHPEAEGEAAALRHWDGQGAVRLLGAHESDDTLSLLLERAQPGTPLRDALPEPEQDEIVATVARRLWQTPLRRGEFRSLGDCCVEWLSYFEHDLAAERTPIDPGLGRAGAALFRELPRTARETVLLSTDLHAGNVLASDREPWLAIDPKPYAGDPAYEGLQHMLNCDRLRADPAGLARRMAALLEVDAERLTRWLFARCVVESVGDPDLAAVATTLAAHSGL